MLFEYVDNVADAEIRASGETLNEAFCQAAVALFSLMINVDLIEPQREVKISVCAKTLDLLLVEWLSGLLTKRDLTGLVFSQFSVSIEHQSDGIILVGSARGELFDASRHEPRTEVKGITYAGLRVWEEDDRFITQCVVDV